MIEGNIQQFLIDFLKSLKIDNCDTYLVRPKIAGNQEDRKKSYVCIGYPNGINYMGAFAQADGMITIGTKDKIIGLPNAKEITRISSIIKEAFPKLTNDYSLLDFEFASDDSDGMGWHEYYYSFQIYINNPN